MFHNIIAALVTFFISATGALATLGKPTMRPALETPEQSASAQVLFDFRKRPLTTAAAVPCGSRGGG